MLLEIYQLKYVLDYPDDPVAEVALNLIRVDHSTGRAIVEVPIRPRPSIDLIKDVRKLKNSQSEESAIKSEAGLQRTKLDSTLGSSGQTTLLTIDETHQRTGE